MALPQVLLQVPMAVTGVVEVAVEACMWRNTEHPRAEKHGERPGLGGMGQVKGEGGTGGVFWNAPSSFLCSDHHHTQTSQGSKGTVGWMGGSVLPLGDLMALQVVRPCCVERHRAEEDS